MTFALFCLQADIFLVVVIVVVVVVVVIVVAAAVDREVEPKT